MLEGTIKTQRITTLRNYIQYTDNFLEENLGHFQCVLPPVGEEKNISGQTAKSEDGEHLVPHSFRFSVTSEYQFKKLTAYVKIPSGTNDIAYINVSYETSHLN